MTSNSDIITQTLVITFKSSYIDKTTAEITNIINLSTHKINYIYNRVIECEFNSELSHLIIYNK